MRRLGRIYRGERTDDEASRSVRRLAVGLGLLLAAVLLVLALFLVLDSTVPG